jgi:tudor domain-containing protein 3
VQKSGWYLTPESIDEFLAEKPNLNANELIKKSLNYDLRNIGAKSLAEGVINGKLDKFEANHVLQIVKVKNIAAPKENENSHTAPPLYKVTLTDGTSNCNALALEDINKLNLNALPGTKLLLHGSIKIKSSLLILTSKTCELLGGNVEVLVQKWKQSKELQEMQLMRGKNLTHTAPPKWIAFGSKQISQVVDTSQKVFAQNQKQEEDETSEFSQARQAALAEAIAAKTKVTKTFTQQSVDKVPVRSEDTGNVKFKYVIPENSENTNSTKSYTEKEIKEREKKAKGGGKNRKNLDFEDENDFREAKDAAKPSAVTLFDLFKTKLDIKDDGDKQDTVKNDSTFNNSDEYKSGYNRESSSRGRGRGRGGPRNANTREGSFRDRQQQGQSYYQKNDPTANRPTFNLNDFNFELSDTTSVTQKQQEKSLAQPQPQAKVNDVAPQKKTQNSESQNNFQPKTQPIQNNYNNDEKRNFNQNPARQNNDRPNTSQNQRPYNTNGNKQRETFNQNDRTVSGHNRQQTHNQSQNQNQQQYRQNDRFNSNNNNNYTNQNQQQYQQFQQPQSYQNAPNSQYYQSEMYYAQQNNQQQMFYSNNNNNNNMNPNGNYDTNQQHMSGYHNDGYNQNQKYSNQRQKVNR